MTPNATHVTYKSPYKLLVTFTNGKMKEFDLQPYLDFPVYEPLKNEHFCSKAFIKYGTVAWNEDIDIDPDRLFFESIELIKKAL